MCPSFLALYLRKTRVKGWRGDFKLGWSSTSNVKQLLVPFQKL